MNTYGPLAPGITSHWKFVDDFLKTCLNLRIFCLKMQGLTKWVENGEFLLIVKILLYFPQFLSVGAVILHEVPQCTWYIPVFYWPTSKNTGVKNLLCVEVKLRFSEIIFYLFHVKWQLHQIKTAEMRAKFVRRVLPPKCLTKKHVNLSKFPKTQRLFCCSGSR